MLPALIFSDRRAEFEEHFYFQCAASNHGRIRKSFPRRGDREDFIRAHDAQWHTNFGRALRPDVDLTLRAACEGYLDMVRADVEDGIRDRATLRFYETITGFLLDGIGGTVYLGSIAMPTIHAYVTWRRENGTSQGARVVKEIKAIQTIARAMIGHPLPITVPLSRIRPVKRPVRAIDTATLLRFLDAMPTGSIEQVYCITKWVTTARDIELAGMNVGGLDVERRTLTYAIHDKASVARETRTVELPEEIVAILVPLMRDKLATDPLFCVRGRHRLHETTLRRRFRRASVAAGIFPLIISVGQIRHEAITAIALEGGAHVAQALAGHKSITTTEGYVKRQAPGFRQVAADASESLAARLKKK